MGTLESAFIGAVDSTAKDFTSLADRITAAAENVPPSHTIKPLDLGKVVGSVIAFLEHGDTWLLEAVKGPLQAAAVLGRQDLTEVKSQLESQFETELAALQAKAQAAGVTLATPAATPASTASAPVVSAPAPSVEPADTDPPQLTAEQAAPPTITVTPPPAPDQSNQEPPA